MSGRIFATEVWALDADVWGALGFSKVGVRNRLAGEFKPDDFVLYIGTAGEPTKPEEQSRLLALVKIDSTHVSTADAVEPATWERHLRENEGVPKWPFGLPLTEVWQFTERPFPSELDVLPRIRQSSLGMKLAVNYEELNPVETAKVLALPRQRLTDVYTSPVIEAAKARQRVRASLRPGAGKGPMPSSGDRTATYFSKPSWLYCMELVGGQLALEAAGLTERNAKTKVFKIGWAISPDERSKALNFPFPNPARLGWKLVRKQSRASQLDAYELEQAVLNSLHRYKLPGKSEILCCDDTTLDAAIAAAVRLAEASEEEEQKAFVDGLVVDGLEEGS
jgi:hypothetical protein